MGFGILGNHVCRGRGRESLLPSMGCGPKPEGLGCFFHRSTHLPSLQNSLNAAVALLSAIEVLFCLFFKKKTIRDEQLQIAPSTVSLDLSAFSQKTDFSARLNNNKAQMSFPQRPYTASLGRCQPSYSLPPTLPATCTGCNFSSFPTALS